MKIAYFDCFSGASGDMILGALLDAGLELELLRQELTKLPLSHFEVRQKKVRKNGLGGTQAEVIIDHHHHHHHRHLYHIEEIIESSSLSEGVKHQSLKIFRRLAEAEARVHRTTVEHIHFHEVGAMDAIIDVVGSVAGLAALGVERIYCSPLHVGSGTVQCAHGILPVPAPATAELIKGVPFYSRGVEGELLTPTGAAILTTLATSFGPLPSMSFEQIGYGAGTADLAMPNLLRVFMGEGLDELTGYAKENVAVLETNIKDLNPQMSDYLIGKLRNLGALEVFLTPVHVENSQGGDLLTVICQPAQVERFCHFLLQETTSTRLRWRLDNRVKLRGKIQELETPYGSVLCEVAEVDEGVSTLSPE
jgi:uncharacterized protein (TIGR00299 family) protein